MRTAIALVKPPRVMPRVCDTVFALAFLCASSFASTPVAAQEAKISDNFDSETVGDAPEGWKAGGGGYAVVTNNVCHSKPNSLALLNNKVGTAAYALKHLETAVVSNAGETVVVKFQIRLAQKDAAVNAMLTDPSTAFLFRICFNNGGQITASSGKEDVVLGPYEENRWYEVRLTFVPMKREYEVEVRADDKTVAGRGGLAFEPRDFYYVYLQNYGAKDAIAVASFDDITVTTGRPGEK